MTTAGASTTPQPDTPQPPRSWSRTLTHLADGREFFYYDATPGADRSAPDRRPLPQTHTTSQLRHDALLGDWVIVAGHRQSRTFQPPPDQCPLDPSTPERSTEIPASDYDVVVFENRFPSLSASSAGEPSVPGVLGTRPGVGRCEVVCFTSDHDASFADLTDERARFVVDVWADRTADLSARDDVRQVFPFENRGAEIGVTLAHPHGQIYAYPFVTPRAERVLASARQHAAEHGGSLFDAVLEAEHAAAERIVARGTAWTAFVPFAAHWPFEVHLYPHRHVADLTELTSDERDELASLYLDVLRRFDRVFGTPIRMPYIAAWHQAPVNGPAEERELFRLHARVFSVRRAADKLKFLAGSESGENAWTHDVGPERAAQMLRDAL
jgi:UDPglucose--hexose-1-phosphate uridylyltransferase